MVASGSAVDRAGELRSARIESLRALEWKPLAAVGVVSYSLYLWHVPLLDWLDDIVGLVPHFPRVLAVAVVCLAVAFLSYRVVEAPFLRLRKRWDTTAAT